eukprot:TRINITY_DN2163_c0_g1_i1.p1 TRINITY_DN2163_c0_g1~~TRINITY_DN2163_c0_g1_i1.p1  ORF type:complete len:353 (+),score=77.63 TRINITY_DN2163_c0_g1_i1:23-1081(+)
MWGGSFDSNHSSNNNNTNMDTSESSYNSTSSKMENKSFLEDINSIDHLISTENTGETFRDWRNPPGLLKGVQFDEKSISWKKIISRGHFSEVWKANYIQKNDESSQKVCIKKMLKNQDQNNNGDFPIEVLFAREVAYLKLLSAFNHPNIVKFLGAHQSIEHCFIMTEFIQADTIYKILHEQKIKFTKKEIIEIAIFIVSGMNFVHSQKIMHRDLTTENILLDIKNSNQIKIIDFGFAFYSESFDLQHSLKHTGNARWRAPEITNHHKYSSNVDVYSFGIIFNELFSGEIPFSDYKPNEAAYRASIDERPPIKVEDEVLSSWIKYFWHKDPSQRPPFYKILSSLKIYYNNNFK